MTTFTSDRHEPRRPAATWMTTALLVLGATHAVLADTGRDAGDRSNDPPAWSAGDPDRPAASSPDGRLDDEAPATRRGAGSGGGVGIEMQAAEWANEFAADPDLSHEAPSCRADVDGDRDVDAYDLAAFMRLWALGDVADDPLSNESQRLAAERERAAADFDASGAIDFDDLIVLLSDFGGCG